MPRDIVVPKFGSITSSSTIILMLCVLVCEDQNKQHIDIYIDIVTDRWNFIFCCRNFPVHFIIIIIFYLRIVISLFFFSVLIFGFCWLVVLYMYVLLIVASSLLLSFH